jgi:ribonuclease H / adenosylcobalamin/alpha-ribazole phosphatase
LDVQSGAVVHNYNSPSRLANNMHILICDGGYKRQIGYGSYLILQGEPSRLSQAEELSYERFNLPGHSTNNQAEYGALVRGLQRLEELGAKEVTVIMDSELVLRQLGGSYAVRNLQLRKLYKQAKRQLAGFEEVTLLWQSRFLIEHFLGH